MMSSKGPDDGANVDMERRRGKIGGVPIISRTISIDIKVPLEFPGKKDLSVSVYSDGHEIRRSDETKRLDVTVWEMDKPSDLIQEWWSIDQSERNARVGDPFGVVMWPGSILAAKELMKLHHSTQFISPIANATVLVLGAGTGVEAQTAALLGAKRVIATDINPLTLKLLEYGANNDLRIGDNFKCKFFDLFSDLALPACDILIAADVLYNPELAKQVGRRLHEAIVRSFDAGASPTKVIITDSQQFHGTNFLEEVTELRELNAIFKESNFERLRWETHKLESVQGSGVLIDEDQTYDVDARMISWGWRCHTGSIPQ
jgi:predicted nicotinamide N-methyase